MAVKFTNAYGDIDEAFYTSAENAFKKAMILIQKHGYKKEMRENVKQIVESTGDIGWGF